MKKILALLSLALAFSAGQASAAAVTVYANGNSTSGGSGAFALNLTAGQSFSVSVDPDDLWNAGALPRWSNADGLQSALFSTALTDTEVQTWWPGLPIGTQIGSNFGLFSQNGLNAPYGSLVGQIGGGNFFFIGTNYFGVAASAGPLTLWYFDSNYSDNFGSITANVSAVPEPESLALLLAGLGLIGGIARRRQTA